MRSHHTRLRERWAEERSAARRARQQGDIEAEWRHLERAHVLSQPMAVAHVRTHVAMLGYGRRRRDRHEIAGQLLRVVVAAPATWTGRYPAGNTGGANVGATKSMPIPEDLQAALDAPAALPVGR